MAFSSSNSGGPMVDMNVTPLVDVMLVLLIIFMVTMPPMTYPIGVDLPQPSTVPPPPNPPTPIDLKIDAGGQITWNGSSMPISALEGTMKVEAERYATTAEQPVIQIDTDKDAQYDTLARVLANAKNAGLIKIGFVDNGQR
jgi:biopolymer transport protein ExbD